MKKILKISAIMILTLIITASMSFAGTAVEKSSATMSLVKDDIADINFGEYGKFTKKKSDFNADNKTIDLSLIVKNDEEKLKDIPGEVVLLIDSSGSMDAHQVTINGTTMTRKEAVLRSANTLVSKLFSAKPDIKIGVAEYAFYNAPVGSTEEEKAKQGTLEDAYVNTALTSDKDQVVESLSTVGTHDFARRTDIEAGIKVAQSMFSNDETIKKYLIILSDGLPNVSLNNWGDADTLVYYDKTQFDATKQALTALKTNGIDVISCLIDMLTDSNANLVTLRQSGSTSTDETILEMTKQDAARYIFGTVEQPTAGLVYNVADEEIESAIVNNIYQALVAVDEYVLTDINVVDYIPDNIQQNFDISLIKMEEYDGDEVVKEAKSTDTIPEELATVKNNYSSEVDKIILKASNDAIWVGYVHDKSTVNLKLDKVDPQQKCVLTFRLTLKDKFDSDIVGINLPTNRIVTVDYKENDVNGEQKQSDKCPVVMLDVPAPKNIPQTGSTMTASILVVVALGIATFSFINYKRNKLN